MKAGFPVRLCFDPMIYFRNWQAAYTEMIRKVALSIDLNKVRDISVGSFRISDQYLKNMRKKFPESEVIQYPYICDGGYYQYPEKVRTRMEDLVKQLVSDKCPGIRIYDWR
jgi:spore photoproduct lyase